MCRARAAERRIGTPGGLRFRIAVEGFPQCGSSAPVESLGCDCPIHNALRGLNSMNVFHPRTPRRSLPIRPAAVVSTLAVTALTAAAFTVQAVEPPTLPAAVPAGSAAAASPPPTTPVSTTTPSMSMSSSPARAAAATSAVAQTASPIRRAGQPITGRYIVLLKGAPDGVTDIGDTARDLAARYSGTVGAVYTAALRGFSVRMSAADAARLSADGRVASVQQDLVVESTGTQTDPSWNLDRIDQAERTLSGTYDYDTDGAGAHIYVFDSGIRTSHRDFAGRIGASMPGTDHEDCGGHGTAVAGAAAGTTWGVAKRATVHPVRVLDCDGAGAAADMLAAIDWVTATAPRPAVVNMSWVTGPQDALDAAIRASVAKGITYVAGAGNDGGDACRTSPQRVPEVIVVGATDGHDRRMSWSSYGSCVDIFAPGVEIPTPAWTGDTDTTVSSGTSLSSPIVAGAASLYLAQHPTATPAQVRDALSACATTGMISDSGPGSPDRLLRARCGNPVSLANPGAQTTTAGQTVSLKKVTATSAAGGMRYAATGLPAGLAINASTGAITGSAAAGATVTVTARDAAGASTFTTFRWRVLLGQGRLTGPGGLCVDNPGGSADATPIQLYPCNDTGPQLVTAHLDGRLEIQDRCVTAGPEVVVLRACDGGAAQIWVAQPSGEIRNPAAGRCLNAASADWHALLSLADCAATALQLWELPSGSEANEVTVENPGLHVTRKGDQVRRSVFATSRDSTQRITWAATGLPAGLILNAGTGMISGVPTTTATATVTVTASDEDGVRGTATFTWQVADGRITGPNGFCVDDYTGNTANGNPIVLWSCNDGGSQLWSVRGDGRLEVVGKCLTIGADGVTTELSDCSTATTQVWTAGAGGQIRNPASGRCLTAADPVQNTRLTVAACTAGNVGQIWSLPTAPVTITGVPPQHWTTSAKVAVAVTATALPSRTIARFSATGLPTGVLLDPATGKLSGTPTAAGSGGAIVTVTDSSGVGASTSFQWTVHHGQITGPSPWCADNSRGGLTDGNPIIVWFCNDGDTQLWTVRNDGRLQVQGRCMTVAGNGTSAGTPVVIGVCGTGAGQVWQSTEAGELRNPASGRCLTAPTLDMDIAFVIADCVAGSGQLWTLPTAPRVTVPITQQSVTGIAVSLTLTVTSGGGEAPALTVTGLPPGLALNASRTISGTPTQTGQYQVTVRAASTAGVTTATFTWFVIAPGEQGVIIHPSGRCVDGGGPDNTLWMFGCNFTDAQLWKIRSDGRVAAHNSCMAPAGGAAAVGTQIVIQDCGTAASEVWRAETGGVLRHVASGHCLSTPTGADFAALYLGACTGWKLPLAG
ncbi:ricin-type beta-trefoil lectin domain protein [Catenuloplanes atrovinosus]|uniref:Subtilisin family serine protease n=1 Tax=Catenuloplanes atrovinosus TaxID=137266 RepID=A0AAE4CBS8_9ACTN|nr:ricin-type beta-trefoil lectin domain protein [Catenuloplanes atrovinosus]MDR7277259.1 subtilisin family serine protease [Catenuloplanes atrovinosus]